MQKNIFKRSALLALGLLVLPAAASARGEHLLLGTWCGAAGNPNMTNYRFTERTLTVTHIPQGTRKVFRIDRYEMPRPGFVSVWYFGDANSPKGGQPGRSALYRADYSNFSSGSMVQQPGVAPAYLFRRCR